MARGGDVAEIVAECGQAMWPVQGWKLGLLAWEYGGGSGKKKIEGERRDVHNPGTGRRCGVDWQCEAPERLYGGEARRAGA